MGMKLNMRTKMTHYVDYCDLESFISKVYGLNISISAIEETGNDTTLAYDLDGELSSWEMEEFAAILADPNNAQYQLRLIMNKLVADEKIPAGSYNVWISW